MPVLAYRWKAHSVLLTTILLLLLSSFFYTPRSIAQDNPTTEGPIATYQKNRQTFIDEQQNANRSFKNQVGALQEEIEALKTGNDEKNKELNRLESVINGNMNDIGSLKRIQSTISFVLFPLLSAFSIVVSFMNDGYSSAILLFFLSLTVLNVFLYTLFQQKALFQKNKTLLVIAVIILIGSIASPLFANDQTKREQVISKLESTEKMLSKSEYERFISILEEKPMQHIKVPELRSGDPLFQVYPEVVVDAPEYWFTLAALYSHEKQNGKTLDAVKKITQGSRLLHNGEHQKIIINCIKYLLQEQQTQLASTVVDSLSGSVMEVSTLLEIATLLRQNGMQTSGTKTLGYAIAKANTVADLVRLAQFFINQQERDKCNEALEKALSRVRNIDDVLLLAGTALDVGKDPLIGKIITTTDSTTSDYKAKMAVVDLFLKHERKEEAVSLVSMMIKGDSSKTEDNIKKLLYLIDASLKRNFLPQATDATETLMITLGLNKAKKYPIQLEAKLKTVQGIPDEDAIMLPQFYGLINEEQGFNDKAEDAYIRSVLESLSTILQSYGYNFPDSLNDFYLLGRIWVKGNRGELIAQLDRVYSSIEKQFIKQLTAENDEQVKKLDKEREDLKKKSMELQNSIDKTRQKVSNTFFKLVVQSVSTIATILFIFAAFGCCVVLAHRYSKQLSMAKTFGFFMKLMETTGWLQVLSVLGSPSGVLSILFSQFFLIFQMIQENTRRVSAGFSPLTSSTQVQAMRPSETEATFIPPKN